jgi:hypothetical protein
MAIRKNTKRIDPRYFLNETTTRDLDENVVGLVMGINQAIAKAGGSRDEKPKYYSAPNASGNIIITTDKGTEMQLPLADYPVELLQKELGLELDPRVDPKRVAGMKHDAGIADFRKSQG